MRPSNLKAVRPDVFSYWKSTLDGQWYFQRQAPNGAILHPSNGYVDERAVTRAIKRVQPPTGTVVKRVYAKT